MKPLLHCIVITFNFYWAAGCCKFLVYTTSMCHIGRLFYNIGIGEQTALDSDTCVNKYKHTYVRSSWLIIISPRENKNREQTENTG